jgi:high affinity sulfate transporter 1
MSDRVLRFVPGIRVALGYQRAWLTSDIVAGLVLTAVLVPVGMGYAEAAGLPAIAGLYATIIPLLAYALFGPSPILVLGPDSSLAAIIAATIAPLAIGDPGHATDLAAGLALISGAFCIAFGVLRLGLLTDLLSKPIRIGYLNGIALTVFVGQLPKLFGFSVDAEGVVAEARGFIDGVMDGLTNPVALAIGLTAIAVIEGVRRWRPAVPGVLIAAVGGTIVTGVLGLAATYDVPVVGALPQGLPGFGFPDVTIEELTSMVAGGLAIAVVSMADTSVLSRTFAGRSGLRVDQDQELRALGAANIGSGLFSGFSISASASRTPVAQQAGSKTQLTGVVGALAIVALLLFVPGLTTNLPQSVLAAIVMTACLSLVDLEGLIRLWRLRRSEFALSMTAFLGVAAVGVVLGIFLSVALALAAFVWRAWRPYSAILGRVDGMKGYHDVTRYPEARRVDGLVLFRWDAPLFFANAELFREQIEAALSSAPTPTKWVVVAAEPVTDVDMTAADMLAELIASLEATGMSLRFAELKDPAKDRLKRYGLFEALGAHAFFPTVGSAVDAYLTESGIDWVDWEDRDAAVPPAAAAAPPGDDARPPDDPRSSSS